LGAPSQAVKRRSDNGGLLGTALATRGPGALDFVFRCGGVVLAVGFYQPSAMQDAQGLLDGALRKAGLLGDLAVAQPRGLASLAHGPPPQVQVDDEGRRTMIMAHQIAEQNVDYVLIHMEGSHTVYST
jgi:hypothetical protein